MMSVSIEDYRQENYTKNKIDKLLDIIGDGKDKKILIFSNYNESFNIIKRFLDEKKHIYLELRGTKEKRDNTIDSYKYGNVNILLLNTIQSGAGLNLQETSDIILFHRIHDYQKTQVIGRANRIGRKIELNVHYLE
jgi:SNF2 family DNA or RNA helicase